MPTPVTKLRRSPAKYVLYGHSHSFETVPLLKVGDKRTFYFNTGTWKKTVMKNLYDPAPLGSIFSIGRG